MINQIYPYLSETFDLDVVAKLFAVLRISGWIDPHLEYLDGYILQKSHTTDLRHFSISVDKYEMDFRAKIKAQRKVLKISQSHHKRKRY
jgi:hypothetical protein